MYFGSADTDIYIYVYIHNKMNMVFSVSATLCEYGY